MHASHRDSVWIFHLRIEVHKVRIRAQRRSLNPEADGRRIPPLDLALERRSETVEVRSKSGKFLASTIGIDGISANEFLLVRIFQILPARHPGNRAVADMVRETRLANQLRQISPSRLAIKMVAEISAQLPTGIGHSVRPVPRFRIQ